MSINNDYSHWFWLMMIDLLFWWRLIIFDNMNLHYCCYPYFCCGLDDVWWGWWELDTVYSFCFNNNHFQDHSYYHYRYYRGRLDSCIFLTALQEIMSNETQICWSESLSLLKWCFGVLSGRIPRIICGHVALLVLVYCKRCGGFWMMSAEYTNWWTPGGLSWMTLMIIKSKVYFVIIQTNNQTRHLLSHYS